MVAPSARCWLELVAEVAKTVKPLFDKFIDFFDIFDLSFFVSGATFVAAIAWARMTPHLGGLLGNFDGRAPAEAPISIPGIGVVVLVFASYIAGMTCFAVGRFSRKQIDRLRDRWRARRGKATRSILFEELAQHGVIEPCAGAPGRWQLTEHAEHLPWLSRYFVDGGRGQESALYVRMWAELRQHTRLNPSFSLLRRYWVSAATLDGLFVALSTWSLLLLLGSHSADAAAAGGSRLSWLPVLATSIGAIFCLREARRYSDFQREELVASLLHAYDPPDPLHSPPC